MLDDSKLWNAFANEPGQKGIGIVADLRRPDVRCQLLLFPNLTFQKLLQGSHTSDFPFVVAVGELERPKGGIFGVLVLGEAELPTVLRLAIKRMAEVGMGTTIWMIDTAEALKPILSTVLADVADVKGAG